MVNDGSSPTKTNSSKKKKKQQSIKTTSTTGSTSADNDNSLIDSLNHILSATTSPSAAVASSEFETKEKPIRVKPIVIPKESNFIKNSFNLLFKLFFSWVSTLTWTLVPYILLLGITLSLGYYFLNLLRHLLPSLPTFNFLKSFSLPSLPSLPSFSSSSISILPTISTYYCSTIGIGCGKSKAIKRENELSSTAREVRQHAVQALDIFQSVLAITNSGDNENGVGSSLVHTG